MKKGLIRAIRHVATPSVLLIIHLIFLMTDLDFIKVQSDTLETHNPTRSFKMVFMEALENQSPEIYPSILPIY